MIKRFRKPVPLLQPFIDRFWSWEGSGNLPQLIPGNGLECIFHYGTPFATNESVQLPVAHIFCPRAPKAPILLQPNSNIGFISIRFRTGAIRHFCSGHVRELVDTSLPVEDLWGGSGVHLTEQIGEAKSFDSRVDILESAMISILDRFGKTRTIAERVAHELYYFTPDTRVELVADQFGISRRHLLRLFREDIGIAPKEFLKIARFGKTVRTLLLTESSDYNSIALDNGYYDQSHFIHDFHHFVGTAPSKFLTEKNFMSHFYNTSLT